MGIAYVYKRMTALAAAVLSLLSLSLGGCATATGGSSLMDARGRGTGASENKRLSPGGSRAAGA